MAKIFTHIVRSEINTSITNRCAIFEERMQGGENKKSQKDFLLTCQCFSQELWSLLPSPDSVAGVALERSKHLHIHSMTCPDKCWQ